MPDLAVDTIHYDCKFNCRGPVSVASVEALAELIRREGLIHPITVRSGADAKIDKEWHLIAGHRRFIAVRDVLKWDTIPAVIIPKCDDRTAQSINLLENLGRHQLHLGQEVRAIEKIFGKDATAKDVAEALGTSERWAKARLTVRYLEKTARKAALDGKLTASDVLLLITVPPAGQKSALHELLAAKQSKEGGKATAKIKGSRVRPSKSEVYEMMTLVLERGLTPTWARSLAWAAGEISDQDFLDNL